MFERINCLKSSVITTLSLTRPDLALTFDEWAIIEEILPILKPFYQMTVEISAEKSVTLSKVLVLFNILDRTIGSTTSNNGNIITMFSCLQNELSTRFGDYENNYLYAESAILDPRFRKKAFSNNVLYEKCTRNLREKIAA